MARHWSDIPAPVLNLLRQGTVIPAHPLALDEQRRFDPKRMSALTRYYVDAGSGGLAVGVHTTQFAIREVGLYEPVLKLAAETAAGWTSRPLVRVGGLAGRTEQACREAAIARGLDYHAGLLSLAAMKGASEDELIEHCAAVAKEIPLVGFYLQPSVGGIRLSFDFWRRFAAIENVVAIKMAPFNRYATLDVIRGVVAAKAEDRVTLYTGNDDHIVADLVTPYTLMRDGIPVTVRIKGGLLGHWSVWVRAAVQLLARCQAEAAKPAVSAELLALDAQVTDCNSALFDVAHAFHGCIAGCHEILRRQGLLRGIWCLDPNEGLSPGQAEELTRVAQSYPHLTDDAFVAANLQRWLAADSNQALKELAA
ncbi:dihydrodipicolinate synthase family protein [Ferrovibrio sp.]|uniref:dihydrodipicolinate synthase family protein n=1 Tax=Ferrovibrio sp. TaxID=1917215 RepID=UPI003D2BB12C